MKKPRRKSATRLERLRKCRSFAAYNVKEWERKLLYAMTKVRKYRRMEKNYTKEIEKELEAQTAKGPENPTRIVEV